MDTQQLKNIYRKLILIGTLSLIPVLLSYLYYLKISYNQDLNKIDQQISFLINQATSEQSQVTEGVRQLLISISSNPNINSSRNCSQNLSNIVNNFVRYHGIAFINQQGQIICSSNQNLEISQELIQKTLSTNTFQTGTYRLSKENQPVINFAYPSNQHTVIFASLNLNWLNSLLEENYQNHDYKVTFLDQKAQVIATTDKNINDYLSLNTLNERKNVNPDTITFQTYSINHNQKYRLGIGPKNSNTTILVSTDIKQLNHSLQRVILINILTFTLVITTSLSIFYFSSRKILEKQLSKLLEINYLKEQFVSLASHQLRTPITGLKWLVELIKQNYTKIPSSQSKRLTQVEQTLDRLNQLTTTLITINKLENHKIELNISQFNLTKALKTLLSEIKDNRKINIISPQKVLITTDLTLLLEAVRIIINNAISYSKPNKTIKLVLSKKSDQIKIEVIDQGIGIPKNEQKQVFTRFFRSDNAKTYRPNGSGLGLFLAKLISNELKGNLSFESSLNQGSIFTITLPSSYDNKK